MQNFHRVAVRLSSLVLILLVGCQPIDSTAPVDSAENGASTAETATAATIHLPDGVTCAYAGTGATLAFDEKRLSYTCTDPAQPSIVIVGDPIAGEDGQWMADKALVSHGDDGFTLEDSEILNTTVTGVELEDGTICLFAGEGATLAFDEKRLNYTCSTEEETTVGLIGDFQIDDDVWMAEQAIIVRGDDGFEVASSEMVPVTPVMLTLEDGVECAFAGRGAGLAFDGQRVNYTCTDPNADIIGLLGDPIPAMGNSLTVEIATIGHGDEGFTLENSEELTFLVSHIDLADDTQCAFAGEGATLAFDEKRLNYTCGEDGDNTIGLLGDFVSAGEGIWTIEKAVIGREDDEFVLESSELALIAALRGSDDGQTESETEDDAAMTEDGLTGTVWAWQNTTTEAGDVTEATTPANYTLEFLPEGEYAIQADCNSGSGAYTVDGDQLTILPGPMTMMACPPESMDIVFLQQLGQVESYVIEEGNLILTLQDAGGSMTFAPLESAAGETAEVALSGTLTGTVTYLQRIALLPGSVIEVKLEDVSIADAAAPVLASQVITTAGENVPIPFELTYDPADIEPNRRYALRVRITVDGELEWINTEQYGVLTNGNPTTDVEVIVSPV